MYVRKLPLQRLSRQIDANPTVPKRRGLLTRAPMVTYSMYGPTGETSYSRHTTPPSVYPNRPKGVIPSGGGFLGMGTIAGRNQKRPSKRHGYSSSRPFNSFCALISARRLNSAARGLDAKIEVAGGNTEPRLGRKSAGSILLCRCRRFTPRRKLQRTNSLELNCTRNRRISTPTLAQNTGAWHRGGP